MSSGSSSPRLLKSLTKSRCSDVHAIIIIYANVGRWGVGMNDLTSG